jgi:uncharacterized protein (AIM24 family)
MTQPAAQPPQYRCPWCGHASDASARTCPACGAAVDVRLATDDAGWTELPPIRDMTKLQFGQSFCQVEGKYVPVADFKLAAGDGIYFPHHLLLWKETEPAISAMPLKGAWKRMFAGLPMIMTQASGPGRIAFSKDAPGELLALPLSAGQSVDVREHVFMVATHSVAYDWFQTGIWFRTQNGNDTETHYPLGMYIDRFTAPASPGLLLLHGEGNIFVRHLRQQQSILIQPRSLLYKDPSVRMHLHFEKPGGTWRSWRSWGDRYIWLNLTGPGRVAIQSKFGQVGDPGSTLTGSEPMSSRHNW